MLIGRKRLRTEWKDEEALADESCSSTADLLDQTNETSFAQLTSEISSQMEPQKRVKSGTSFSVSNTDTASQNVILARPVRQLVNITKPILSTTVYDNICGSERPENKIDIENERSEEEATVTTLYEIENRILDFLDVEGVYAMEVADKINPFSGAIASRRLRL